MHLDGWILKSARHIATNH